MSIRVLFPQRWRGRLGSLIQTGAAVISASGLNPRDHGAKNRPLKPMKKGPKWNTRSLSSLFRNRKTKNPLQAAKRETCPCRRGFQRSAIQSSTTLGLGHNPINLSMRDFSDRMSAFWHGSVGESSKEGISSIFFTNLEGEWEVSWQTTVWTRVLKASI